MQNGYDKGVNQYIKTSGQQIGTYYSPGKQSFNGLNYYIIKMYKGDTITIDFKGAIILGEVTDIIVCDRNSIITDIIALENVTSYTAIVDCIIYFTVWDTSTIFIKTTEISQRSDSAIIDNALKYIDTVGYRNQPLKLGTGSNIGMPRKNGKKFMAYVSSESSDNINLAINCLNSGTYEYIARITSTGTVVTGLMPQGATASFLINESNSEFNGNITFVYEEESYTNLVDIPNVIENKSLENITIVQNSGGYISYGGGVASSSDENWKYSDYIEVLPNTKYLYKGNLPSWSSSNAFFAIYDENYKCLRVVSANGATVRSKELFINIGEKYLRLSSYVSNIELYKEVITGGQTSRNDILDNRIDYLEKNFCQVFDYKSFCGIYKFGVIGDSLSVGHMDNVDPQLTKSRSIVNSWPQILARKNGQVALNFGKSGVTAGSWWDDSKCRGELIKTENYCQSYIIGLGVNDQSTTIGELSDVDWSDYNNNQNTFIGNFTKILQLIHSIKSDAIIFVLTPAYPYNTGVFATISQAIKDICNDSHITSWDNVFLVDLNMYSDYMRYAIRYNQNYHFSSCGYASIANLINAAISKVIDDNIGNNVNLRQIGFIEYGSNLTPIE